MITKILMGGLIVLTILITGCEALLPPMILLTGDTNAIPGCEIMMASSAQLIDQIPVFRSLVDTDPEYLPSNQTYVFYPVEYTFARNAYWVKVWVSFALEFYDGETPEVAEYDFGYRWLPLPIGFPPDQLRGCEALSLSDGIAGMDCQRATHPNRIIPARVGPGLDRAIFINLTSDGDGVELHVDGHQYSGDGKLWYRIWYNDRHLWVDVEDFEERCDVPLVNAPPILLPSAPQQIITLTPVAPFQDFAVYHCRHLFGSTFEWYSVRVTYDENDFPLGEQITGGPFTGEWREGCPAGELTFSIEQPSLAAPTLPGDPPPTDPPPPTEEPPTPTPTPPECMECG